MDKTLKSEKIQLYSPYVILFIPYVIKPHKLDIVEIQIFKPNFISPLTKNYPYKLIDYF